MLRKTVLATILGLALAAPGGSSRAAHRPYTFAYVSDNLGSSRIQAMARGGREAAKALGMRYFLSTDFQSMITRPVDALAADGYDPTVTPILDKARKAGIVLVASGDDIAAARDVWVSQSSNVAYAEALADALAAQVHDKGEYAILDEEGEYPVAVAWKKIVTAYVPKAYPNMKLDGVFTGSGAGDKDELDAVEAFMAAHPHLEGLIGIVPTEAWMAAEAIARTGKIGKVFSAGNGDGTFDGPLPGWVRKGAAEFVYASDPVKLGYLTVWAADYLLTGHHFKSGAYQVGGPIGLVRYHAAHRELRLGQPLTITKTNVELYANKF